MRSGSHDSLRSTCTRCFHRKKVQTDAWTRLSVSLPCSAEVQFLRCRCFLFRHQQSTDEPRPEVRKRAGQDLRPWSRLCGTPAQGHHAAQRTQKIENAARLPLGCSLADSRARGKTVAEERERGEGMLCSPNQLSTNLTHGVFRIDLNPTPPKRDGRCTGVPPTAFAVVSTHPRTPGVRSALDR